MAWFYFGIGEGVFIPYVETSFRPARFEVTKPLIKTEQKKRIHAQGRARKDRGLHNLFFCDEPGCAQIFEDQEEYMNSIARETYTTIKNYSKTY